MDRIGRRDLGKPERVAAATPADPGPADQGIPAATHARLDVQVQVAGFMDQAADFTVLAGDVDRQHVPATPEITQEV
jgi:hypothetical protein